MTSGTENRRLGKRYDHDGAAIATGRVTPTGDAERLEVEVLEEAVPVILVPGIMGSNLRDVRTGQSVWRANGLLRMAMQWLFRSATTRRRKLNPDTTEVDPRGRYLGRGKTVTNRKTARQRGWGTVARYGYGKFVPWLDKALNDDEASPWAGMEDDIKLVESWAPFKRPHKLSVDESEKAWGVYSPVHCVGYNWLRSNAESGEYLVGKINEIIEFWRSQKNDDGTSYRCDRVVLVTHSMGGLVSRAAVMDAFGGQVDANVSEKVAGIVHGVMPAFGAAAAYHHIRTGYDFPTGLVLGRNAAQVTAVLANSPGGLELVPNTGYPAGWLLARSTTGRTLMALPEAEADAGTDGGPPDPYLQIYTKRDEWYRLIDADLIDPGGLDRKKDPPVDSWTRYLGLVLAAARFHKTLGNNYHDPTYSHFGNDPREATYQTLPWVATGPVTASAAELKAAHVRGNKSDPVKLDIAGRPAFKIGKAEDPGDDTVPAVSGGAPGTIDSDAVKQSFGLVGLAHGSSYQDKGPAQMSTLYSIGKIIGRSQ